MNLESKGTLYVADWKKSGVTALNGATVMCEEEAGQKCHGEGFLVNQTHLAG